MLPATPADSDPFQSEPIHLLTAREAARYLRVSLSTLYRMEQQQLLTPLRTPGGHRRYTLGMLNASLSRAAGLDLDPEPADLE